MALDNTRILSIVRDELSNADQWIDFETPLKYYLGSPRGDETAGHSTVVSTDVADSIEWIMPQIMKSFTQNNEICIFDPLHDGDEQQAAIESEYVYSLLMKENDGFILLHQFVKDALIQQNGIIKVYYDPDTQVETRDFTGLVPEQLEAALMSPNVELLAKEEIMSIDPMTGQPIITVNARISVSTDNGRVRIEPIAPEDFRVNTDHNSINLDTARFAAHLLTKTISELNKAGYDTSEIPSLDDDTESDYRFLAQNESADKYESIDPSMRLISIAECYLDIDINNDGIAEFCKVIVVGHENPTLVLDVEELDYRPLVSTTPFIMSHKWRGLSIYDRLKDIQDQKTSLWRNLFDNIYLQNNQRTMILEGQVNIDDLLVSRPGGIIRTKSPNAVTPLVNPPLGKDVFDMMTYLDIVRAGRVGVAPEGEVAPHQIGASVGSQGVERLMTAKEELVGLIVRVIAETGIKPLCIKIRDLCTNHIDAIQDFLFKGQWLKINPAEWIPRYKCTVRVGTGTGDHRAQLAAIREIMIIQQQLQSMPGNYIMDQSKQFAAFDDFCTYSGLNSAAKYFIDPSSPQGQQEKAKTQAQTQQQSQIQMELQQQTVQAQTQLAAAEGQKAQAQMQNVQLRAQVEQGKGALQSQKQQSDLLIASLKQQLADAEAAAKAGIEARKLDLEERKFAHSASLELTKLEVDAGEQDRQYALNLETTGGV